MNEAVRCATVAEALAQSHSLDSGSARLDTELLLVEVLGVDRAFLRAWPEHGLSRAECDRFAALLARRRAGEPIAYILGRRDFWTLSLEVSPHTLIPRPDTETLVEVALSLAPCPETDAVRVLDLGTGSGAVALALASERPAWRVDAVDIDPHCVSLAARNAERNGLQNVRSWSSDWFSRVATRYDLIVSNPPYIDAEDRHLRQGDVRFEPRRALVAARGGLAAIGHIAGQATGVLVDGGVLAVEHGCDQARQVRALFESCGYREVRTTPDAAGAARVTSGRRAVATSC